MSSPLSYCVEETRNTGRDMIQQLILNTLMKCCHPKSEGVVVSSVNVQSEPEVQTDSSSVTSEDSTSNSAEVISTESVPTAKEPS